MSALAPPEVEAFLIEEARLLDERRYADWLGLFTDDCSYWVPLEEGQQSPSDTVSLMYDDRKLLETRVRRLAEGRNLHAQQPNSRTSRTIANATVEGEGDGALTVRSKFQMIEYRRDKQRLFGGTYTHVLESSGDGYRIRSKRVDLVNSESVHDGLTVPF